MCLTDLIHQNIPDLFNDETTVTVFHQGLFPSLQNTSEELSVNVDEILQAGEDAVHSGGLKLQLLGHPLAVDVRHDLQRPEVVHFCLHQL